jgi:hypothetical protein
MVAVLVKVGEFKYTFIGGLLWLDIVVPSVVCAGEKEKSFF